MWEYETALTLPVAVTEKFVRVLHKLLLVDGNSITRLVCRKAIDDLSPSYMCERERAVMRRKQTNMEDRSKHWNI